jgi:glycosyltransferase involved in cell wall biosynthesis
MPMRLLLITNVFPNPIHDVRGTFNFEMARALVREQVDLAVLSPVSWIEEWKGKRRGRTIGRERHRLIDGILAYYPPYYYTPKVLRRYYGSFMWHSIRKFAVPVAKEYAPDAVISYWAHPDGYVGLRIAQELGKPCVVVIGGSDVLLLCKESARRKCVVNVLSAADAVIVVSHDLKRQVERLGIDPKRVHLCWRGVNSEAFCPGDCLAARGRLGLPLDKPLVLCVAGMVPVKGLPYLVDAAKILKQRGVAYQLLLVGAGPLQQSLRSRCLQRGLHEEVRFVGQVMHDALPDWYRAADLTVLPSLSEGIPNVLLESMASGTPFVATSVGGIPEIAAEGIDFLVPPRNPLALADAIAAGLMRGKKTHGRHPNLFSWSESARAMKRIVESLRSAG